MAQTEAIRIPQMIMDFTRLDFFFGVGPSSGFGAVRSAPQWGQTSMAWFRGSSHSRQMYIARES